jgi:CTP:molybdopterin cytidylyltransferase MocA
MDRGSLPLLIMTGTGEGTEPERMVSLAKQAITLDLVERALTVPSLRPIVVATNSTHLAQQLAGFPVQVDLDDPAQPFHFGRRLAELVARYGMESCFYIGGGAGPLLPASEMAALAEKLLGAEQLLITNNFYSSDWVAFAPTSVLRDHPLPENDNELAWLLGEHRGLPIRELPRSAASQFDVDTPTDLLTLAAHHGAGPHARAYLEGLGPDPAALDAALPFPPCSTGRRRWSRGACTPWSRPPRPGGMARRGTTCRKQCKRRRTAKAHG